MYFYLVWVIKRYIIVFLQIFTPHVLNLSMNLGLNLICIFLCSEFIVLLLILTLKNAYFESF